MGQLTAAGRTAVKHGAALWDRVRPGSPGIVILIYHRVGAGRGGQMDLDPREFRDQMASLAATRRVIDLDTAALELASGGPVEPGVVVTFDDGTTDWVDHAMPALADADVPATFYVATDFVEAGRPMPDGCPPISWAGLAELQSTGLAAIGSHTHTHALLDRIQPAAAAAELDRSIELIGERLGSPPRHFAYPKALVASAEVEPLVRERFVTATVARTRPNVAGADLHRLTRSPIQPTDGERFFLAKAGGGMHLEDDARDALNRLRYRGATR